MVKLGAELPKVNYRSYPKNKTGYPFLDHPVNVDLFSAIPRNSDTYRPMQFFRCALCVKLHLIDERTNERRNEKTNRDMSRLFCLLCLSMGGHSIRGRKGDRTSLIGLFIDINERELREDKNPAMESLVSLLPGNSYKSYYHQTF